MSDTTPSPAHTPPSARPRVTRQQLIAGLLAFTILCVFAGGIYFWEQSKYIYTEKADIEAPLIQLASQTPGVFMHVNIEEGDQLYASESVARVGDEIIRTQVAGQAVNVQKDIGTTYPAGKSVVTMIQPQELRVIARIQEDQGLKDIRVGQHVVFTLDAFGSTQFPGTVENISATDRQGDVVFNISDKREEKEFNVKINYDHDLYPYFQNGMSARVWIVK